jgi:predicted MFS family arabinose efflux permease
VVRVPASPVEVPQEQRIRRGFVIVIAVCCGVTVANIYLALPALTLIDQSFRVGPGSSVIVATSAQIGYAAGLLFLVALGDMVRRTRLTCALLIGTVLALVGAAVAPDIGVLAVASALAGAFTVVPQVLIPFTVQVVAPQRQGRAVAAVQAGLLTGIILSRVLGGQFGQTFGWRSVYLGAAVLTALVGAVTVWFLPRERKPAAQSYPQLMASLFTLLREERALRWACLLQVFTFGAYSVAWATLVFLLTGPPFHLSVATAGLFGLFGLVSMVTAPVVGRLTDRLGATRVRLACMSVTLLAGVAFLFAQAGIGVAIIGIMLINIGAQGTQIANQTHVFGIRPGARSRVNTLFMVSSFGGSAAAAQLGSVLFSGFGWRAVSLASILAIATGFVIATRRQLEPAGPDQRSVR